MSIEAVKLALDALNEAVAFREGGRQKAIDAVKALRAALSQQPATGEPVAHLWQHAETGRTLIVMSGDVWTANDRWCYVGPLVLGSTHPAPSVPDDDFDLICNAIDKADSITVDGDYMLDSDDCIAVVRVMQVLLSVRAAMLAANEGGAA